MWGIAALLLGRRCLTVAIPLLCVAPGSGCGRSEDGLDSRQPSCAFTGDFAGRRHRRLEDARGQHGEQGASSDGEDMSLLDLTGKNGGPGTIYLGQTLGFIRPVALGDTLTVSVKAAVKIGQQHRRLGYLAEAQGAGIVLGARIPTILTSRADAVPARMESRAVALIAARRGNRAAP